MKHTTNIYYYAAMSLFLSLSASEAVAGSMSSDASALASAVFTVSGGPVWENAGETQSFYLVPGVQKTYQATSHPDTLGTVELFLGLQHVYHEHLIGQFGLAVAGTSSAHLQGNVWEDADPNFNNYFYTSKVDQLRLAFKGKLLAETNYGFMPYLSAGIGPGFNHAYDFTITPKIVEEIPAPPFNANSTISFSYTLGAGLQTSLNSHWQVGVGYEFADWGASELGLANGQTMGHGIQLNNLYTQELQFYLSYIA